MRCPRNRLTALLLLLTLPLSAARAQEADPAAAPDEGDEPRLTFVLVHGAWGGGWTFKEMERLLRAEGHEVYRPTMTGLGEKVHLINPDINLDTHIQDIVNVILWEQLDDVVLLGHSYGGMVVTGVADRIPDRIGRLVYLDAFLPENGQSLNTSRGGEGRGRGRRGGNGPNENNTVALGPYDPDAPLPHDVPHPANTLSQPIELTNQEAALQIPTTYVLTVDPGREPEQDTFHEFAERARSRDWEVLIMEGDHNVQRNRPQETVDLLLQIATE